LGSSWAARCSLLRFRPATTWLLPAFYLPIMFMLFALIFRGIAFGFRLQAGSYRWYGYRICGWIGIGRPLSGVVLCGSSAHTDGGRHVFRRAFRLLHYSRAALRARPLGWLRASSAGWLIWKTRVRPKIAREVAHAALVVARDDGDRQRLDPWPTPMSQADGLPGPTSPISRRCLCRPPHRLLIWRSLWGKRETYLSSSPLYCSFLLCRFGGQPLALHVPRQFRSGTAPPS